MITATGLELRAGTRILLADTSLRLHHGDRDRPGRAQRRRQDHHPAGAGRRGHCRTAGAVTRTLPIGYLPQDPREGDLDVTAKDRVLSARGLDVLVADLEKVQIQMAELTDAARARRGDRAVRPDRGAVLRARRVRRRIRGRPDLLQPRPARPGAGPAR